MTFQVTIVEFPYHADTFIVNALFGKATRTSPDTLVFEGDLPTVGDVKAALLGGYSGASMVDLIHNACKSIESTYKPPFTRHLPLGTPWEHDDVVLSMLDLFTLLTLLNDGHDVSEIHVEYCKINDGKVVHSMSKYTVSRDGHIDITEVPASNYFYDNVKWDVGVKSMY